MVAKGFNPQIPPVGQENTCKPFNATEVSGFLGATTGTVCVSQDGGTFLFHYSYHNYTHLKGSFDTYFESGTCRFSVASDSKRAAGPCRTFDDFGFEMRQDFGEPVRKNRPLIGAVGKQLVEEWKQAFHRRQK